MQQIAQMPVSQLTAPVNFKNHEKMDSRRDYRNRLFLLYQL